MPYKDKADRRAFEARRAEARRNAGLCANCNDARLPGESRCQKCKDRRRKTTES